MNDFILRISQAADSDGRVSIEDVIRIAGECKIKDQRQTFQSIGMGVNFAEAWPKALADLLRNIGMAIMLGIRARPGIMSVRDYAPWGDIQNASRVEVRIRCRLETMEWSDTCPVEDAVAYGHEV